MKILFLGDIVGQSGVDAAVQTVPRWRKEHSPDLVIANAENSDPKHARGATIPTLDALVEAGVDAYTLGDHCRHMSREASLDKYQIVRPANLRGDWPAPGHRIIESPAGTLLLISLIGKAFIKPESSSYFKAADAILAEYAAEPPDAIFVDFHAEVTSEKNALGHYLDGLVSTLVGTHTHVPTADTRLLPKGTAYQSDVGMCGGYNSSIGFDIDNATRWLHRELGGHFPREEPLPAAGNPAICDAVLVTTDGPDKASEIVRLTTRP